MLEKNGEHSLLVLHVQLYYLVAECGRLTIDHRLLWQLATGVERVFPPL